MISSSGSANSPRTPASPQWRCCQSASIASNTRIFSFVNALLLRPPPVKAPKELYQVWRQVLKSHSALERFQGLSYPGYAYFCDHNASFVSLGAFDPLS
jgi:hypothetical protein